MIRTVDGCRTYGWGARRHDLRVLAHFLAVMCWTDGGWGIGDGGWGKGVGEGGGRCQFDVGDGFSSRLNHMRAAANSSWPDQDRILAMFIYPFFPLLPASLTHQSTPKRVPSQPRTAAITSCFTTGRLATNHTRPGQISLSQQVAHAYPISRHLTCPRSQGPKSYRIHERARHNASDQ